MKNSAIMIYKKVLESRLQRKQSELQELTISMNDAINVTSSTDKRRYIELKAIINELENCIDIADSMVMMDVEK